jgi:type I restriction enzyme S subunit
LRAEQQAAGTLPSADKLLEQIRRERAVRYGPPTRSLIRGKRAFFGSLPEGWVWSFLATVGDISGGITKNSRRATLPRVVPYLRVANVYANRLDLREVDKIGVTDAEYDRTLLSQDDILFVEGNGSVDQIGRTAIWNGNIHPCVHQNHLIKCRLVVREMAKFILYWFLSPLGRSAIVREASSTSGLYTLSIRKVGSLEIPVPSLAEQKRAVDKIESRLSVLDYLDKVVDQGLEQAEVLRQSILKKAFEGRLLSESELAAVRNDPEYEPANKLLERI